MSELPASAPAEDAIVELFDEFIRTARSLHAAVGVTATQQAIVDLAVETVEACDAASIFVLDRAAAVTVPASSGVLVDTVQLQLGEGPCLDAISTQTVLYAGDLASDGRWPSFRFQASAIGIRGVLAVPLRDDGMLGALNLYAAYPNAFGIIDRAKASVLATLAGPALASTQALEAEERRCENLQSALVTRELIGQALGILMERECISADQAFAILRRSSQNLNIKLRDVAQRLVDTGQRPPRAGISTPPAAGSRTLEVEASERGR